jgi:hypothetical protein
LSLRVTRSGIIFGNSLADIISPRKRQGGVCASNWQFLAAIASGQ